MNGFHLFARPRATSRQTLALLLSALLLSPAAATEIRLRNGFTLEGNTAPLKGMNLGPAGLKGAGKGDPIIVIDDVLHRYYVPNGAVEEVKSGGDEPLETFTIKQIGKADAGLVIHSVGPAIRIQDWDEFGRRIDTMATEEKPVDVIQCITAVTPKYVVVEAFKTYKWTQYIATTSVKPETLYKIIMKNVNPTRLSDRLRLVRFYLQMEAYEVAEKELDKLLKDFPERKEENENTLRSVRQALARRALEEIKARRAAGQHRLAYQFLKGFPTKGVAGEILAEVDELLNNKEPGRTPGYEVLLKEHREVLKQLEGHVKELCARDTKYAAQLEPILKEIMAEFSVHTLDRLVPYRELSTDPSATLEQKVALGISGWTQGAKGATNNLPIALSLYKVRDLVHQYINAEIKLDREEILTKMRAQEGASPARLAALVAHMKPPKRTEEKADGFYELSVDGLLGDAAVNYIVQLPPEYNPYRRYPAIVTLHGGASTPQMQVDWWSGGRDASGNRRGQGSRQGYIVIAPAWAPAHHGRYGYSLKEHVAVLHSLRDACRRFSIDTDRVFLSGHAMGGTAAWDIGLAHPDLFAGVIPIACKIEKYCDLYWHNAEYLPIYYVVGQMDGDMLATCARSLDRYMKRTFPIIVSEFVGRGHEDFSDEQLRLFDWMSRQRRDFAKRQFECVTMRPWDSFFWWIEMEDMPAGSMILPEDWDKTTKRNVFWIKGRALGKNNVVVSGGAARVSLYLSPELVDFDAPLRLTVTAAAKAYPPSAIKPSVDVILEDIRTRGDRQHPFWAKIVVKDATREAARPAAARGARADGAANGR